MSRTAFYFIVETAVQIIEQEAVNAGGTDQQQKDNFQRVIFHEQSGRGHRVFLVRLFRLIGGVRLIRLSQGLLELADASAELTADISKFSRAEDYKRYDQYHDKMHWL